ncbi:hypothetical protein [Streptomyces sp. 351MFTsu5.1]|uniref:hypothetical protein n=1 Tax=Streptomyces sp. 351MFTsu5.1 TaxID=1172180 RepID=UPI000370BBAF|nr:hypothetical protein [Streptomyces sp. 351MFTsu5.1]
MGSIVHDVIVVTTVDFRPGGLPDIDSFRASLPEDFRQLVVGPIPAALNGYVSYAFLPDGSKEGRAASNEGDDYRARFAALFDQSFTDGDGHEDVVSLGYGPDHRSRFHHPVACYIEIEKDHTA